MLNLFKIAVTGGMSSGKSTVCRLFEEMGAYVVSADTIVHQLLSPDTSLGKQIIDLLGHDVIRENKFDRQKIADKVFKDLTLLKQLEHILHPAVFIEMKKQYSQAKALKNYSLFVAEVPLLFESYDTSWFDATLAVDAPVSQCMERYIASGGTAEEFQRRSKRLLPNEEKRRRADYTILNDSDLASLTSQLMTIKKQLLSPNQFKENNSQ